MKNQPLHTGIAFYFVIAIAATLTLLLHVNAFGEGSIGANYSQVADDTSWGLTYSQDIATSLGELETAVQLQSGERYLADAHASLTIDTYKNVGIRPYLDITGKSEVLEANAFGGKVDYGAVLNFALSDESEVGVGIFLRNADPFSEKVLYALVDGEYVPQDTNAGINYDNPAPLNVKAYKGFEAWGVDAKLTGSAGIGAKDRWLILDANYGYDLGIVEATAGVSLGNRWYTDDADHPVSEADFALILGVSRNW